MTHLTIFQVLQGIDNPSAGPTYSVGCLSHYLVRRQHDVTVVAMGNAPKTWPYKSSLQTFGGVVARLGLAPPEAFRYVRRAMLRQLGIIHGHGVWRAANLFPLIIDSKTPIKIVWSPRGMFSPWSWNYKGAIKKPFWYVLQKPALDRVHCFHATALSEVEDIRRLGFRQPISLIPNGVEVPHLPELPRQGKTIVFLSRIHEVKGLHLLIPAWQKIAQEFPDWELLIAGKIDSSYGRRIVTMVQERNVPRIRFLGEVLGSDKATLLASARLFVLPTFTENFGVAIAEALAHATPVITTTQTPWVDLEHRGCGWCINPTEPDLIIAFRSAMSLSNGRLEEMGKAGRAWIEDSYAWEKLAKMFEELYAWLLYGGQKPSFVDSVGSRLH